MALLEDFHDLFLGLGNRLAALGFDQDAEQGVGIEHRLGQCDRDDDQLVGIHAQALADRLEHADHAQATVADADQLTDSGCVAEHFLADRGADHGDRRAAIPVLVRQPLSLRQFEIADGQEFMRRAGDHDFAQAAAEADFRRADGERCEATDGGGAAQRAGVVDAQVARRAGDGVGRVETTGAGASGQHDDQIGADRGKLADDVAAGAIAQRSENDDGSDPDRHGEHRKRRPHRVAGGRVASKAQGVSQAHARCPVSGGRLP